MIDLEKIPLSHLAALGINCGALAILKEEALKMGLPLKRIVIPEPKMRFEGIDVVFGPVDTPVIGINP